MDEQRLSVGHMERDVNGGFPADCCDDTCTGHFHKKLPIKPMVDSIRDHGSTDQGHLRITKKSWSNGFAIVYSVINVKPKIRTITMAVAASR